MTTPLPNLSQVQSALELAQDVIYLYIPLSKVKWARWLTDQLNK